MEQWRAEARREKDLRKRLEVEVKDREEKFLRLESDMKKVTLSNEDLRRQLEVAMVINYPFYLLRFTTFMTTRSLSC